MMIYGEAKITKVQNGYTVSTQTGISRQMNVYNTFNEVVDALRLYFDDIEEEKENPEPDGPEDTFTEEEMETEE